MRPSIPDGRSVVYHGPLGSVRSATGAVRRVLCCDRVGAPHRRREGRSSGLVGSLGLAGAAGSGRPPSTRSTSTARDVVDWSAGTDIEEVAWHAIPVIGAWRARWNADEWGG